MRENHPESIHNASSRETAIIENINPYKSSPDYLSQLKVYLEKIDTEIKKDEPDQRFYSSIVDEMNERTKTEESPISKWLFYDITRYYMSLDKTKLAINHTWYDAVPFSILANELKKQGKYQDALAVLSRIQGYESRYLDSLTKPGLDPAPTVLNSKEKERQMYFLEKSRNTNVRLLGDIAYLKIKTGDNAGALSAVEQSLSLDPTDVTAYGLKAQVLMASGDNAGALSAVEQSLSLDPTDVIAYGLKAQVLMASGDNAGALSAVEQSLSLDPTDVTAYGLKAQVLMASGDNAGALSAVEQSLSLDPTDVIAYGLKAQVLMASGDNAGALSAIEQKLKLDPTDVIANSLKAQALMASGDYKNVEQAREILESLESTHDSIPWLKAKCYGILGELGRAKKELISLLNTQSRSSDFRRSYVVALLSILYRDGYTMDVNELSLVKSLREYFNPHIFEVMMEDKNSFDWSTVAVESLDDKSFSKAFQNSVYGGTYTSAVNAQAKHGAFGVPVHVKSTFGQKPVVVERRHLRPKFKIKKQ